MAAPITTVGSTKAAVNRPFSRRRPGNRNRAKTKAGNSPAMTVRSVLTAASHTVNQATSHVDDVVSVARMVAGVRPRARRVTNGQA